MRLINADELKEMINREIYSSKCPIEINHAITLINNAPTVELFCSYLSDGEVRQPCVEAPCEHERPTGECSNCDYRKFTEKFIDGVVEVMNKNGISSVEQLSEILKGAEE